MSERHFYLRTFAVCIVCIFMSIASLHAQDFSSQPIPDSVFARINGKSFKPAGIIKRSDLRYLTLLYINEKGEKCNGEMICNKAIADDLIDIFRELYNQRYPIHSIRLVDEFNADDETSMEANNTSCFNYRGTTSGAKLSKHAYGMAIDINPLWNPCIHVSGKHAGMIEPKTAKRTHQITTKDLCYRLFIKHGFRWGGSWRAIKDYQHFER